MPKKEGSEPVPPQCQPGLGAHSKGGRPVALLLHGPLPLPQRPYTLPRGMASPPHSAASSVAIADHHATGDASGGHQCHPSVQWSVHAKDLPAGNRLVMC